MFRRMSLRARLLAGMVVLVAAGLGAMAIVTYEEQRAFLLHRVEEQVRLAAGPVAVQLGLVPGRRAPGRRLFGGRPSGLRATELPPGTFGELANRRGQVIRRARILSYPAGTPPALHLPARIPLSRPGQAPRLFTVQATGRSSGRYQAGAFADGADAVVVAVPLREADDTLHHLVVVEVLVGAGVILALVGLGWGVIRVGLRPLERIGRVASEIARGDLSRRVAPADPHTEVGRLGRSLNEMLAQIEQAFSDRRRSEEQLRRFIADASHELRTPLASIRGYAELFGMGAANDPAALERAMSRIEAEAVRMSDLVEDLLALAALDQAPEHRHVAVDMRALVEQAADDTRATAPGRAVTVNAPAPAPVRGDPDQLRQLIANLTRNAVIHTPAGTAIALAVRRSGDGAAGPERIIVQVRDHGAGVPVGAEERLFERFWRSEGGRARGRGGAGLGLAIARAIAQRHDGELTVTNAPEGGAVFQLSLPAAEPPGSQETLSVLTADSYVRPAD